MVAVQLQHVGVGCNRVVNAVSWAHPNGLVLYAAHHAVAVYDPQEARVVGTLLGHTGVVNCVGWVPPAHFGGAAALAAAAAGAAGGPALLASGAADSTVRLWLWAPPSGQPWQPLATLEGHTAPVTSVITFPLGPGRLLLVSTAGDGDVLVWECAAATPGEAGQGAWALRQRIHVGFQMQDCAAVARLPADPDWLVLALGGVDAHVRLYTCPPGGQFGEACKLSGHQDWMRGLAFAQMDDGGRLLLASASQDKYVRVWAIRLQEEATASSSSPSCEAVPSSSTTITTSSSSGAAAGGAAGSDPLGDMSALSQLISRYAPKPRLATPAHAYSATLEALLIGHEDWVHSVAWHPPVLEAGSGGRWAQPPCLLSASMDRTMMVWRPDKATGLWMSIETVGDAGPNHLGYYTGVYNSDGTGILTHGFTGALHIWRREGGEWLPKHALGGHFAPIVDACWSVNDSCLLTVSVDQTARITYRLHDGHWCEIARPQVHGHDFSCAAFLPSADEATGPGRTLYASGSEEKVIRVFEAPQAFRDTLAMARGEAVAPAADSRSAFGASLPALGLSNKAVYVEAEDESPSTNGGGDTGTLAKNYTDGPDLAPNAVPSAAAGPPLEEHLAQNTLWPEVRKLYGHGNELYCLAADPRGRYLASACRAQSASVAGIWLWDARDKWVGLGVLAAHTLTVTQLAFSPDGRYLASAARDRSCALFERCDAAEPGAGAASPPLRLAAKLPKAHARIVWGLGWSLDSRLLATGSRDNTVKLWAVMGGQQGEGTAAGPAPADGSGSGAGLALLATLPFGEAVRAVSFAPWSGSGSGSSGGSGPCYALAVGLENGSIHILELRCSEGAPAGLGLAAHATLWQSEPYQQHAAAVRRLCWRRAGEGAAGPQGPFHLASVGDDHAVRVFEVVL